MGVTGVAILLHAPISVSRLLAMAAPTANLPVLPDLSAKLHPGDSAPWTVLFVLTAITLLPDEVYEPDSISPGVTASLARSICTGEALAPKFVVPKFSV